MTLPVSDPYPTAEKPQEEPAEISYQVRFDLPAKKPWVTYVILGICVVFFGLQMLSEAFLGGDLPFTLLGKINEYIRAGQVWRLFTPALLHGSIAHLGFNMYALYAIGPTLEQHYGHKRFLVLFVLGAFAGNVFSFAFSTRPALGASTALFGIIAAQGVFIYQNRFLFKDARSALINTIVIVIINLVLGLRPGIDNWGHLGGLLGGLGFAWFAGPVWRPEGMPPVLVIKDQHEGQRVIWAALGVFVLFSLGFIVRLLIP